MVSFLLDQLVDVNAIDIDGNAPLHYACALCDLKTASLLFAKVITPVLQVISGIHLKSTQTSLFDFM